MTLILIIFSQLCIIFAVWRLSKKKTKIIYNQKEVVRDGRVDHALGRVEKAMHKAKLAEKMADRAFNMASSANVGISVLQKALAIPRLMTKKQAVQNEVAKNGVDKLFTSGGSFDYLRPILSDEENDLLDEAEALHNKEIMNGSKG